MSGQRKYATWAPAKRRFPPPLWRTAKVFQLALRLEILLA
jgi:hypothetical protein